MQRLYREDYAERWPDYATRLERLRERDGQAVEYCYDQFGRTTKDGELVYVYADDSYAFELLGVSGVANFVQAVPASGSPRSS